MKMGQVVVVGGSKGLGRVVAERFAAQGHPVTVISRSPAAGNAVGRHLPVDLETMDSADAVVSEVLRGSDRLRYLIFCQRYRGQGDRWQGEMHVSLNVTRLLIDGFRDCFIEEGDRAVGVVSSVYADRVGGSQPVSYHVAKAGLNQLVHHNAWTLGRQGIRINAVMPLTYLKAESQAFYLNDTETMEMYRRLVPLGKMGTADDVADVLEFLCSEKAAFVNGQSIYVDGGVSVVWPEELAQSMRTR
ncbi:MAG TPA: SDR family oxidoreductase [Rhodocyclaceae bacterium]|nr:SDR family oxidoreductase [Rhodocyclaceae bacterium]